MDIPKLFVTKIWNGIQALKGNNANQQAPEMNEALKRQQANKGNKIDDKMAEMLAQQEYQRKARAAQEEAKRQAAQAQNNGAQNQGYSDDSFVVPILFGQKQKPTKRRFEPWDTVATLKQAIVDEEGGNIQDLKLICKGKPLKDNQTLRDAGVNGMKPVSVTYRVVGGTSMSNDEKEEAKANQAYKLKKEKAGLRLRLADFTNPNISPSWDPDCIMGFDDKDTLRVKMPCGHVFDPMTIYKYVDCSSFFFFSLYFIIVFFLCEKNSVWLFNPCFLLTNETGVLYNHDHFYFILFFYLVLFQFCFCCVACLENHQKLEICCPMTECKKEWEFGVISSAADLDEDEKNKLASVLESRAMLKSGNFKQCPGCQAMVEKPNEQYMLRYVIAIEIKV